MNEVYICITIISCIIIIMLGVIKIMTGGVKIECQKMFDEIWREYRKMDGKREDIEKNIILLTEQGKSISEKLDKIAEDIKYIKEKNKGD